MIGALSLPPLPTCCFVTLPSSSSYTSSSSIRSFILVHVLAAPSMSTNNRNNSRFSTLKVFGFSKERPPPPPPKDAQYFLQQGLRVQGPYSSSKSLYNSSVASLANPTEPVPSMPATPLTADYSRASPVSSQSSPSIRSFAPSGAAISVESDTVIKPKRNIFGFSSLSKRMNRSAINLPDLDSEPQEDEGISKPYNIQVCLSTSHCLVPTHAQSSMKFMSKRGELP